jgi:O-antigen/teichoic acid export membrane protein
MVNLKEHVKLTGVYTFFVAFPAILQLIVYPLIEGKNKLGAEDFGYLAVTEAIVSVGVILIAFGSSMGLLRFYYDFWDDRKQLNKLLSTIHAGVIARGLILLGFVFVFAPFVNVFFQNQALKQFETYGPLLVVIAFNRVVIANASLFYRNEKNLKNVIIVSLLSGFVRSAFQIIGVFYFDMSFLGYIYGTAIGGGVVALLVLIHFYLRTGRGFSNTIHKPLLKFSLPLVFNDLIFWGVLFIDRFLLLKNPAQLGIYDNALKFAIGLQLIIQGMGNAFQPELFRYLKKGVEHTIEDVKTLSHLFIIEAIAIVVFLMIPVMFFIQYFYETELVLSAGLISIVFVRYILVAQYSLFSWPVIFQKKTNAFFLLNAIVLVISLLINIILIPKIGIYGSIIAFLTAYLFQVVFFMQLQRKIFPIPWNYSKVFYFPISIVIVAVILEVCKYYFEWNVYVSACILFVFTFTTIFILYRNELQKIIKKLIGKDR